MSHRASVGCILSSAVNILGYVESPVRNMRATIPILESHPPAVYSTVLLTWASITHDCPAMRQIDALSPIAVANSLSCVTHVKSLSRHKAAGSTPPEPWLRPYRTGGSAAREYSLPSSLSDAERAVLAACYGSLRNGLKAWDKGYMQKKSRLIPI